MDLKNNPFVKIFPSTEAAEEYAEIVKKAGKTVFLHEIEHIANDGLYGNDLAVNVIVEEVFNFTMRKTCPVSKKNSETQLLYLEDVSGNGKLGYNCIDTLELVLFERLLLEEPSAHLLSAKNVTNSNIHAIEKRCIHYLFECYRRLIIKKQEHNDFKDLLNKMVTFVVRNAATALKQPDVYDGQNLQQQVVDVFLENAQYVEEMKEFLSIVADDIIKEEGADFVNSAFSPILAIVQEQLENSSILTYNHELLNLLYVFSSIPTLAVVLLSQGKHREPNSVGRSFAESSLGAAFNISLLPKNTYFPYEFFDNPMDANLNILENQLWTATKSLVDNLHHIVRSLLKSCRHETMMWLGSCLDKNAPRGRLSAMENLNLDALSCVSDGFMLNLCAVLLRVAEPFTADKDNPKLLKIDPTFPAAKMVPGAVNGVHCSGLSSQTCLLPVEQNQDRPCAEEFSFVSECFFLTHQALYLGTATVQNKAQRLYQEIGMMQSRLGPDAQSETMELAMTRYLSLRCALIEPSTMAHYGTFIVATCNWLVQVVLDPDLTTDRKTFYPGMFREVNFPLPAVGPPTLQCVPEMLLENVAHFLVAAKRFEVSRDVVQQFILDDYQLFTTLTYLVVFMSGTGRARNPHLRAQLAECLECLVPREKNNNPLVTYCREQLFKTHPHRAHVVESLLDVFVGIEMTGQSVTFEQKFNYRRPMYTVMEYLWSIEEQKQSFKRLAVEAEANMEAVNPPLFLRFLNLLMNDAVFLLDEALNNMASLRNMILAREEGEWENLPPHERQRNESSFVHVGMTARFDNILGTKTIECLVYLSSEIKSIFCHPTMVDRIAAMLNYFLLHLVGPKKKNFKVRDQLKEYMFDPAAIVLNICRIYIHLRDSEEFCAAVSRDGRSYSPQLFSLAESVLVRIGGCQYITDLQDVAARVSKSANQQQLEDELLAEVPDDFLDPIMSTLMNDPVILPSSKQVVDRSTIARHLLSDQSDPFNREPLTMDMVKPDVELKQRIDDWVTQRHKRAS